MKFSLILRSKLIIKAYESWISSSDRVLDVGCGNAVVAGEISKHFNCQVIGTDISDSRKSETLFSLMKDKDLLPFGDNEFDICMFNDVLHHTVCPERLLQEGLRVARKVLIFEMEPTIIARLADMMVNKIHYPRERMQLNIKSLQDWISCLKDLYFNFEYRKIKKPLFMYPFNNFAFSIKK